MLKKVKICSNCQLKNNTPIFNILSALDNFCLVLDKRYYSWTTSKLVIFDSNNCLNWINF